MNVAIEKPKAKALAKEAGMDGAKQNGPKLSIDFPQEGEKIRAGHYAVRVGADGATEVEVSIDRGPWKPCRTSAGYFWIDFWSQPNEVHEIKARAKGPDGRWVTIVRVCEAVEE